jgi:hypothetical protein
LEAISNQIKSLIYSQKFLVNVHDDPNFRRTQTM